VIHSGANCPESITMNTLMIDCQAAAWRHR
jgi:hypothetical protein